MNDRSSVRWSDGTYDSSRICDTCRDAGCKHPTHWDSYREIGGGQGHRFFAASNSEEGIDDTFSTDLLLETKTSDPAELLCQEEEVPNEGLEKLRRDAYDALTLKQRKVWDICMRQGMAEQSAAELLGISRTSVQDRLAGARAKFVAYLRDHADEAK